MSTSQQDKSEEPPLIVFADDSERPWIDEHGLEYKFRSADQVTVSGYATGLYYICEAKDGKYSLSDDKGQPAHGGKFFEEGELTLYDPFAS
ncbi:hypothetical protein FDECE_1272 [Fusarium decemcellulare]|nr:hypothetical protein FDECE_1272 [Fusarium decemcellulare]